MGRQFPGGDVDRHLQIYQYIISIRARTGGKRMNRNYFLICSAATLAACSLTTSSTQVAQGTDESELKATQSVITETPTATMVPHTSTPTVTVTPTPDLRRILEDPRVCAGLEEIDLLANFRLEQREQVTNGILKVMYREKGPVYIDNTGRITGWKAYYQGFRKDGVEPYQIFCDVELFESFVGANTALNLNDASEHGFLTTKYEVVPLQISLDEPVAYYILRSLNLDGSDANMPVLEFVYNNVEITIRLNYYRQKVMPEQYAPYLELIGNWVLSRLKKAPFAE
jgi:hypothetical protein